MISASPMRLSSSRLKQETFRVSELPNVTSASMTVLMTPDMANFAGNVHGGSLLKLVDQAAYVCASRFCGQYVVTLSVDQVLFREPIHVGELVTLNAAINYVGNTSMEVGIEVIAEDVKTRDVRRTNSCYVTMVALDEDGRPVKVPAYAPQHPRREAALSRGANAQGVAVRASAAPQPNRRGGRAGEG